MKTSILTEDGLEVLVDEMKNYVKDRIDESRDSVLEFNSSLLFPTTGKTNTIYIDKTNNKSFRWDSENLKYYSLNDYENIQIINGCA